MLVYIVTVVLSIGFLPLRIFLIEFVLVLWRKAALPLSGITTVAITVPVSVAISIVIRRTWSILGGNLVVRCV